MAAVALIGAVLPNVIPQVFTSSLLDVPLVEPKLFISGLSKHVRIFLKITIPSVQL